MNEKSDNHFKLRYFDLIFIKSDVVYNEVIQAHLSL